MSVLVVLRRPRVVMNAVPHRRGSTSRCTRPWTGPPDPDEHGPPTGRDRATATTARSAARPQSPDTLVASADRVPARGRGARDTDDEHSAALHERRTPAGRASRSTARPARSPWPGSATTACVAISDSAGPGAGHRPADDRDRRHHRAACCCRSSLLGLVRRSCSPRLLGLMLVRRQLRPLRDVAATAYDVTAMPLDASGQTIDTRVPERYTDPRTEVGQVGAALNTLLDHVDAALDARHRSEQQVRQFVADASHELRTPLSTIHGYAELSRRTPDDAETLSQAMGKVETEATRMSTLVDDLLLLARLDSGRPLEREEVDLTRLLLEAVGDARVVGPEHRLAARPARRAGDRRRRRAAAAPGGHEPAQQRPPPHPAGTTVTVGARPRPGDGRGRRRSRCTTTAPASPTACADRSSSGSPAATRRAPARPAAPGSACRWCRRSPRPTAASAAVDSRPGRHDVHDLAAVAAVLDTGAAPSSTASTSQSRHRARHTVARRATDDAGAMTTTDTDARPVEHRRRAHPNDRRLPAPRRRAHRGAGARTTRPGRVRPWSGCCSAPRSSTCGGSARPAGPTPSTPPPRRPGRSRGRRSSSAPPTPPSSITVDKTPLVAVADGARRCGSSASRRGASWCRRRSMGVAAVGLLYATVRRTTGSAVAGLLAGAGAGDHAGRGADVPLQQPRRAARAAAGRLGRTPTLRAVESHGRRAGTRSAGWRWPARWSGWRS